MVSDYHSPVQQPSFSGALKVTRVEQMAQFPQLFRINESLLQRNANFQTLDCFLKQEWGKEEKKTKKKTFLSAILETGLTCLALVFPSLKECPPSPSPSPLHNESLIGFGVSEQLISMRKMCTVGQSCRAAVQWSYATSCLLHFDISAELCRTSRPTKKSIMKVKYFGDQNRDCMEWQLFNICVVPVAATVHTCVWSSFLGHVKTAYR